MKKPVYEKRKCELCKNEFEVNIKNKRSEKKRFCCEFCAKKSNGMNNKGKRRTDEFKKLLSEKLTGEGNPFYNRKHKEDSIKKMKESSKWAENRYKYCNMTDKEKEIFDGIMLSDGCLYPSRISSRLSLGFKYKETLERIIEDLKSIKFSDILTYESKEHKKTGKTYISYFTKSNFYHDLLYEHKRWYIDKNKIVPLDIKLTPILCYWWYVCDGFILKNNVYLCTDSFRKEDLELLKNKLNDLKFNVIIRKNNRIFFDKKSSINFLKWISTDNIQKEYSYKWNIKSNSDE